MISGEEIRKGFADRGYRGHGITHLPIYLSGQRKGVTTRKLKKEIKYRSAIEPHIGHMKSEGKLRMNFLKGFLGACFNALLCAVGHNLRLIERHLKKVFLYFKLLFKKRDKPVFIFENRFLIFNGFYSAVFLF